MISSCLSRKHDLIHSSAVGITLSGYPGDKADSLFTVTSFALQAESNFSRGWALLLLQGLVVDHRVSCMQETSTTDPNRQKYS